MEIRADLAGDPTQVARARALIVDALARWGVSGPPSEVTALLVSELVTNALLHSRPPFSLQLTFRLGVLRVEVGDANGSGSPAIRATRWDRPGGRGLRLVDALATTWGTIRDPGGKRVWFELALPGAA